MNLDRIKDLIKTGDTQQIKLLAEAIIYVAGLALPSRVPDSVLPRDKLSTVGRQRWSGMSLPLQLRNCRRQLVEFFDHELKRRFRVWEVLIARFDHWLLFRPGRPDCRERREHQSREQRPSIHLVSPLNVARLIGRVSFH